MPADDEVLVRAHAASVHPDIWHVVTGRPYVLRLMGAGLRRPKQVIPGTDVAGRVEALGDNVTRFQPGDDVYGETVRGHQWHNGGTFAEYVAVRETALVPKPANLTFEQAAAVPTSGPIAYQNLQMAQVQTGQRVLINGAGGGVGTFAVQLAKAAGLHVTAVDGPAKLDKLRSIGADHVIDYTKDDYIDGPERYDLVYDVPGNHTFAENKRVLTRDGKYLLIGHDQFGRSSNRWIGTMARGIGLVAMSLFVRQLPRISLARPTGNPMVELTELLESGQLEPVIDRVFPLDEATEALRYLAEGTAKGKIVLTM